jgi:hypothetical protein
MYVIGTTFLSKKTLSGQLEKKNSSDFFSMEFEVIRGLDLQAPTV